jgi:hypothetical protein
MISRAGGADIEEWADGMHPPNGRSGFFPVTSALGSQAKLGRRQFGFRLVLVALAAGVLGGQLSGLIDLKGNALPAPPLDATTVAFHLVRGARPADKDLIALRTEYGVKAVVNLSGPNVEERVVTRELALDYVELSLAADAAASASQLTTVVDFVRTHLSKGEVVYLHDDTGHDASVAMAAMLLLLRGEKLDQVLGTFSAQDRHALSGDQLVALRALGEAKAAQGNGSAVPASNPYSLVASLRW